MNPPPAASCTAAVQLEKVHSGGLIHRIYLRTTRENPLQNLSFQAFMDRKKKGVSMNAEWRLGCV